MCYIHDKNGENGFREKRFFDYTLFLTEYRIFNNFFPESTHQAEYYAKNRSKISMKFEPG